LACGALRKPQWFAQYFNLWATEWMYAFVTKDGKNGKHFPPAAVHDAPRTAGSLGRTRRACRGLAFVPHGVGNERARGFATRPPSPGRSEDTLEVVGSRGALSVGGEKRATGDSAQAVAGLRRSASSTASARAAIAAAIAPPRQLDEDLGARAATPPWSKSASASAGGPSRKPQPRTGWRAPSAAGIAHEARRRFAWRESSRLAAATSVSAD